MQNLSKEKKRIAVLDSLLLDAKSTDFSVTKLKFLISKMVCFDPLSRVNAVEVQKYLKDLKLGMENFYILHISLSFNSSLDFNLIVHLQEFNFSLLFKLTQIDLTFAYFSDA